MQIENSNVYVTDYFQAKELFTKSKDFDEKSHFLDDQVIDGLNFIRIFFGEPIIVSSTFRTEKGNAEAGGADNSYHKKGMAIDFSWLKNNKEMIRLFAKVYFAENSSLKKQLDSIGINGVIVYNNFIHIDCRPVTNRYIVNKNGTSAAGIPGVLVILALFFMLT